MDPSSSPSAADQGLHCPTCGQPYRVTKDQQRQLAGKRIHCRKCKTDFTVDANGTSTRAVPPQPPKDFGVEPKPPPAPPTFEIRLDSAPVPPPPPPPPPPSASPALQGNTTGRLGYKVVVVTTGQAGCCRSVQSLDVEVEKACNFMAAQGYVLVTAYPENITVCAGCSNDTKRASFLVFARQER
jgi:predicted Zn finger-like uncharacterized protein